MYGCYTKKQASEILRVSERKVGEMMKAGILRRLPEGSRVWIPREDVDRVYQERTPEAVAVRAPTNFEMEQRLIRLEAGLETLKLGLGFGAPARPKTEDELELMKRMHFSLLAEGAWSLRTMSNTADEMMSLQEGDVLFLIQKEGSRAWVQFVDLVMRMIHQIEVDPEYPQHGMDVLLTRLIRAKDRFYGMLYANSKRENFHGARNAQRALSSTEMPLSAVEDHILAYILA